MKHGLGLVGVGLLLAACGGSDSSPLSGSGGQGGGAGSSGASAAGGQAGIGGQGGLSGQGGAGAAGASGGSGGSPTTPSPLGEGPLATTVYTANATVGATGSTVPLRCHVPEGSGAVPLVVVAHGFQLPASQYEVTTRHLAGFGFVACTADYPAGFIPNHASSAKDLLGAIDYLLGASKAAGNPLSGRIDESQIGLTGHSLGGKLSVLAAAADARVRAVLGLDPVDSSMLCSPTDCPDASDKLSLPIPTAFLGETLDSTATGFGQACAPAADNFQTFYAKASAPSLEVTLVGANHMSFLDDPSTCGTVCSFCKQPTKPHAELIAVTRAYLVAFFSRYLRGDLGYDSWLVGADAQANFVAPGRVTLASKP